MRRTTLLLTALLGGCMTGGPLGVGADPKTLSSTALCNNWARKPITSQQVVYRYKVLDEIVSRGLFSDAVSEDVRMGTIRIGAPRLAVLCAFGQPSRINRTVNQYGEREQWVYSDIGSLGRGRRYVYVEDGVVTAFQD